MKIGDVVKLNGVAGPNMVIVLMDQDVVKCYWYTNECLLQNGIFPTEVLGPGWNR